MKKKILGTVLILGAIVFGASVLATIPSGDSSNMTFTVENGQATLTEYTGNDVKINVPAEYNGSPVTTISAGAFDDENIERIYLPITVTTVETDAFINCGDQVHVVLELSDPLAPVPTDVANWGLGDFTARIREFYATGRADLFIEKGEIIEAPEAWIPHECDAECSYIEDGPLFEIVARYGLTTERYERIIFANDIDAPTSAVDISKEKTNCVLMWEDSEILYISFCGDYLVTPVDMEYYFASGRHIDTIHSVFNLVEDIVGLNYLDTSNTTDMSYMFLNMEVIEDFDFSKINTDSVTDMSNMFYGCWELKNLNLLNFNTENVTNMSYMFRYCDQITDLDLSSFITTNVTDMSYMFQLCNNLQSLDIKSFNTSNVVNMSGMFNNCKSMTELDVSHFMTSNVTDMSHMFQQIILVETLDLSNFDTSNVQDMESMFATNELLNYVDFSSFNTSNVTNMFSMFDGSTNYKEIDLSTFDFQSITMAIYMFGNQIRFHNPTVYVSADSGYEIVVSLLKDTKVNFVEV